MTTPPCYVYLSKHRNYMSNDQWYVISTSTDPLKDVKKIHSSVIKRHGVTRCVKWAVECWHADDVARFLNDWLRKEPRDAAGVGVVAFKMNGVEDETFLLRLTKIFCRTQSYTRLMRIHFRTNVP